jgi:SAM-dependent methyltransferase
LKGRCDARPELAATPIPLAIEIPTLPAKSGADGDGPGLVRRLFEPLGWDVEAEPIPLDAAFPQWGDSHYVRLRLTGRQRLGDALSQLYVLLPVLDDAKHYWVAPDEVDKLLQRGAGWLATHPEHALITRRYLSRRWSLAREAMRQLELARLAEADDVEVEELDNAVPQDTAPEQQEPDFEAAAGAGAEVKEAEVEEAVAKETEAEETEAEETEAKAVPLAVQRREAIAAALRAAGAARVLDLGCGEGSLIAELLKDPAFTQVTGVEVSARALMVAKRRLRLDRMTERQAARVKLLQGALTYTDDRLKGYDAAVLSEVVEHVDPPRLPALEYAVLGAAQPRTVVVTTPNVEYNVRWEWLPAGQVRHADHRFEWTRAEFNLWAERVGASYGYRASILPVGPEDPADGPPTQLAVFAKLETEAA